MLIYKIKNKVNEKCYIGYTKKTIDYRWKRHLKELDKGTNRKLYDAIRKYGIQAFTIEEIDRDDNANQEEWLHLETLYIIVYDSVDNGYNMTYGGIGGNTNKGKCLKGKTCYDKWLREDGKKEADRKKHEMYKRVSIANAKNPPHTKWTSQQCQAMSDKAKKMGWKPPRNVMYGKDHPMFGKTHTATVKDKLSRARKGKTYGECMPKETAARLAEMHRNQFLGKNNPNYVDIPKETLHRFLMDGKTNEEIANILKTSKSTIISKTKQYFGKTPSQIKNEQPNKT